MNALATNRGNTMKQHEIIQAYKALRKLANQELPIKAACKIHRLMVSIRPVWDFQREEEDKILRRLKPDVVEGGGLKFKTVEEAQQFRDRMEELANMDAECMGASPITIPMPEGARLAASDIEALEGFVEFAEE